MKNKTTVSVIIPTYNEEQYIIECLQSLFYQSHDPLEVIVVDDSTDDTWDILSRFKQPHARTAYHVFRTAHKGPAPARNLGAKKAKGDILVFVDADMRFHRMYLEKLIFPIEKNEAVATFTKEEFVANPDNIWSICWSINSYLPRNLRIDPKRPEWDMGFRAIRKDVFFKTKGYQDVGYGEDATVLSQLGNVRAKAAKGAICYHYNPSLLSEVFVSAKWMGKGPGVPHTVRSLLTYSIINSIRRGVIDSIRYKTGAFLIFKVVFDFGFFLGLSARMLGRSYVK